MSLKPPETGVLAARTRFILLVLVVLCLAINWANILTFNFTIICMHPKPTLAKDNITMLLSSNSTPNYTHEDHSTASGPFIPLSLAESVALDPTNHAFTYEFSNSEKSQAMAVVAAGALVANIPIVTLINWYGPRYLFTAVGLFGAFATALIPMAMRMGFNWFLVARVLQGIAFAGDMATFGHFVTYWTYYKQYAFFTATLCVYVQLAPVFTNPISGLFCDSSIGWPGVYYFHCFVSLLLFTTFFFLYRNDPNAHPLVNDVERQKIARGRESEDALMQRYVPYKEILTSPAAWAVFIGGIGNFAGINLVYQFTPTYLNRVQGFEVVKTGFMAALPPLLMGLCKELSGLSNDRIPHRLMSETTKTKVYNSIAFLSMAFFLIVLSFVPIGRGNLALMFIVAGSTLLGFNTGGFYKSGSQIAGPYAPFVLGQVSTAMTVTMLIVPLIVNPLTPNNTREEWALAFYAIAGIMVGCNVFYVMYAKGEPEYWATAKYFQERMIRMKAKETRALTNGHSIQPASQLSNGAKINNGFEKDRESPSESWSIEKRSEEKRVETMKRAEAAMLDKLHHCIQIHGRMGGIDVNANGVIGNVNKGGETGEEKTNGLPARDNYWTIQ